MGLNVARLCCRSGASMGQFWARLCCRVGASMGQFLARLWGRLWLDCKYLVRLCCSFKKFFVCVCLNAPYPLCAFKNGLRHKRGQIITSTWVVLRCWWAAYITMVSPPTSQRLKYGPPPSLLKIETFDWSRSLSALFN